MSASSLDPPPLTLARALLLFAAPPAIGNTTPAAGTFTTITGTSLVNAAHNHANAAGGGSLDAAAIGSGVLANARVNFAAPDAIGGTTPAAGHFTDLDITGNFKTSNIVTALGRLHLRGNTDLIKLQVDSGLADLPLFDVLNAGGLLRARMVYRPSDVSLGFGLGTGSGPTDYKVSIDFASRLKLGVWDATIAAEAGVVTIYAVDQQIGVITKASASNPHIHQQEWRNSSNTPIAYVNLDGSALFTAINGTPIGAVTPAAATFTSITLPSQTQNRVFAAPSGADGVPSFRALVAADIPSLSSVYQPFDNDLTALAALASTGILSRTASNTFAQRTITGTANRVAVTNGDGVSGNPTLDIGTDVVTLTGTQTLTNKTLTAPIIDGKIKPTSNSTTAIQIAQADGTVFAVVDTTQKRFNFGSAGAPTHNLNVSGTSTVFGFLMDYAGTGELPAGVVIGNTTSGSLVFFSSIQSVTTGAKTVMGYWNGGGRSAVEVANVASGNGTLLLMKGGGNVGINSGATALTAVLDVFSDIIRLRTAKTPASAAAAGNAGDICWDSGFLYVCVAASTWKRVAIATW